MRSGIPMEPTLQVNGRKAEGVFKEGLTEVKSNQVMGLINYRATNCQGNKCAISYMDTVKCPRR